MGPRQFAKGLTFRLADDPRLGLPASDAPVIEKLVSDCGFRTPAWMRWENLFPHWALAIHGVDYLACMCLSYSRPIGRIEMLAIRSDLSGPQRGIVVRRMNDFGRETMKGYGCFAVAGVIPFEDKTYTRIARRNGCVILATGNLFMRRC